MKVITDGRTLHSLGKQYGFEYDKKYRYITEDNGDFKHKGRKYSLRYLDGCFYPYLTLN